MKTIASLCFALLSTLAIGSAGCSTEGEADASGDDELGQVDQAATSSGTTKACCTQTSSGGLNDCNKPYYPPGGGPTCVGDKVKALCNERYDNCTSGGWLGGGVGCRGVVTPCVDYHRPRECLRADSTIWDYYARKNPCSLRGRERR